MHPSISNSAAYAPDSSQPGSDDHDGFVAEAGSGVATGRLARSTPYLGETGMEMRFVDGASGVSVARPETTPHAGQASG
jgi:hypothetical protein